MTIRNDLVKKPLEAKFSESKELELLFGMKFNDNKTEEFNQFIFQITTLKSNRYKGLKLYKNFNHRKQK
ncbi:hypothetical protein OLP40_04915 [Campylobacter jejuni]|nr:hypothetical protein C414_000420020 [Campylobacter jejuni subsp. jejuni 414]MCW1333616.1 hypothetical protein [Campylobacter jejuni]MCW1359523.1 hypothetical protein [Campylobacter jejuni]HDZ4932656.1 hypothetical protein [Campylobacter jejuni]HDZ4937409.1 hypothetical protein [Campylobacter jejuni]